jgi:hypothetical protein
MIYLKGFSVGLAFLLGSISALLSVLGTPSQSLDLHVEVASAAHGESGMGVLVFPDGSKFQTALYHLKVVGQLRTVHKLPYYVLSGVGCRDCDANISIYIHSPSDGPMKAEGAQPRFSYPGRITSIEDRRVVSETKVFLGNCIVEHPDAVAWFERSMGNDKRWHESVFVAEIKEDHLVFEELKVKVPKPSEAEGSVQKSACRELPGVNQSEEP